MKQTDLILKNGVIYTMAREGDVVEALAVRDGKIVYTGTTEEVRGSCEAPQVVDLAGKTIAVQTGTTAEEYCMDNGYSVLSFASNNDAQAALPSGKADAWVVDTEAAARMAADQSHPVQDAALPSEP